MIISEGGPKVALLKKGEQNNSFGREEETIISTPKQILGREMHKQKSNSPLRRMFESGSAILYMARFNITDRRLG